MEPKDIIVNQAKALSYLFDALERANQQIGMPPWYEHIPSTRNIPKCVSEDEFIPKCYQTLKFADNFLALLSLDNMAQLGTWGRYKIIVEETFANVTPSQETYIFMLHCNIHTARERQINIRDVIKKMDARLKKSEIKDVVVVSTNQEELPEDIVYARKMHRSFAHWSPYATAYTMKKLFAQYPNSFVVTSNYIGSLLLDNGLFFKMNFRFHPDNVPSIACALEDICTYIQSDA